MSVTSHTSLIRIGGFKPTNNPLASHFGLTPMALPGEEWPIFYGPQRFHGGSQGKEKPLYFICQLNLEEAPFVPEILSDIKLLTVFVNPDFVDAEYFCIRAYKSLEGLVPLKVPEGCTFSKGFEVSFELSVDTPCYDDPEFEQSDNDNFEKVHKHVSKIGGYASTIQGYPFEYNHSDEKPKFCFQINSEEKINLMWGDSGIFYIFRGTEKGYEDRWFSDCQFH